MKYIVVYAEGTSRHDQKNYGLRVDEAHLAAHITRLQSRGKKIVSLRIESGDVIF